MGWPPLTLDHMSNWFRWSPGFPSIGPHNAIMLFYVREIGASSAAAEIGGPPDPVTPAHSWTTITI